MHIRVTLTSKESQRGNWLLNTSNWFCTSYALPVHFFLVIVRCGFQIQRFHLETHSNCTWLTREHDLIQYCIKTSILDTDICLVQKFYQYLWLSLPPPPLITPLALYSCAQVSLQRSRIYRNRRRQHSKVACRCFAGKCHHSRTYCGRIHISTPILRVHTSKVYSACNHFSDWFFYHFVDSKQFLLCRCQFDQSTMSNESKWVYITSTPYCAHCQSAPDILTLLQNRLHELSGSVCARQYRAA